MVFGICCIGKGITDDIEGNGDDCKDNHREIQLIAQSRHGHKTATGVDQIAQRGGIQR